jgi:hypothetical protein
MAEEKTHKLKYVGTKGVGAGVLQDFREEGKEGELEPGEVLEMPEAEFKRFVVEDYFEAVGNPQKKIEEARAEAEARAGYGLAFDSPQSDQDAGEEEPEGGNE